MLGSAVNPSLDIIDTILAETSFRSLLSALQAVQMIDQLKGPGPFTVFAPTDQAFQKLPEGSLREWEKPENTEKLRRLLEGHIVSGVHSAPDLRQRLNIESLTGAKYGIVSSGQDLSLGGAHVLGHPIACTNGVIHVVDAVLQTA